VLAVVCSHNAGKADTNVSQLPLIQERDSVRYRFQARPLPPRHAIPGPAVLLLNLISAVAVVAGALPRAAVRGIGWRSRRL
jgi:hypothetical protein